MHQLQRIRILLVQVDACNARVMHLFEEFLQIRAPLVIHPCTRKKPAHIVVLEYSYTEINVLTETHVRETLQGSVHLCAHSHVEAARVKLIHLLFAPANAPGGEKRSHGIINGLLHVTERSVCPVGTTKSIGR